MIHLPIWFRSSFRQELTNWRRPWNSMNNSTPSIGSSGRTSVGWRKQIDMAVVGVRGYPKLHGRPHHLIVFTVSLSTLLSHTVGLNKQGHQLEMPRSSAVIQRIYWQLKTQQSWQYVNKVGHKLYKHMWTATHLHSQRSRRSICLEVLNVMTG